MLHSKVAMLSGRWWYTFPFLTTAWNDSTAYFCGVAFGKHKLIGLSPNKTLEGFLGALVCNILTTLYVADMVLSGSHFWTCSPRRYTTPFEDYRCESLPSVYQVQAYKLPFALLGISEISMSPALTFCLMYCFFSALIAPFAGFFASGMKRAYKIKDFSDTLPGHGGFVDRLDCHILTLMFNYFMISQLILRDEFLTHDAQELSVGLPRGNKIELINLLAKNQGLPLFEH